MNIYIAGKELIHVGIYPLKLLLSTNKYFNPVIPQIHSGN